MDKNADTATAASARRAAVLREMGLTPLWKLRQPAAASTAEDAALSTSTAATVAAPPSAESIAEPAVPVAPTAPAAANELESSTRAQAIARMDWAQLRASVASCQACALCHGRKQAVLGVGDEHADWLFVGEGPGAEEDQRGEPFVGQAGKLLDAMLTAIGLRRGQNVYIANAVKCRPTQNRTPSAEEMAACRPYLERQIALLQPKLIVALGRPAAQTLLQQEIKISALRGRIAKFPRIADATADAANAEHPTDTTATSDIPLVVTYHPAYLLRSLTDKAKAWEDLCLARRQMKTMAGAKEAQ